MSQFFFQGNIPASKSLFNRALILQSFSPALEIHGQSSCDDVLQMKAALKQLSLGKTVFCGEAGTVLRFMALRASRQAGTYFLTGESSLLKRPQKELLSILGALSVECELEEDGLHIRSQGWKKPSKPIEINREISSQFASGLALSSWNLDFVLEFQMAAGVSEGYWEMTLQMLRSVGMEVNRRGENWIIPSEQKIKKSGIQLEPDYSSCFAIAAAAALSGKAVLTNMTASSTQPDFMFIDLLKQMGAKIIQSQNRLEVEAPSELKALDANLSSSPDLFPVLSILCAFAKGTSNLRGAGHLVFKESNRIQKTAELLQKMGARFQVYPDGIQIEGPAKIQNPLSFRFDPAQDHRMAMAAGLLRLKSVNVEILHPQVVNKSFPEFWNFIGINP